MLRWLKSIFASKPEKPWDRAWPRVYGWSEPCPNGNSTSDLAKLMWLSDPARAAIQFPPEGIFYGGERPSAGYVRSVREQWRQDQTLRQAARNAQAI